MFFRWLFESTPSSLADRSSLDSGNTSNTISPGHQTQSSAEATTSTGPCYGERLSCLLFCRSYPLDFGEYTTGSLSDTALSPHCILLLRMILFWDVCKRYLLHLCIILTLLNAVLRDMRISISNMGPTLLTIVPLSFSLHLANLPWPRPAKLILSSVPVRDPPHRLL